MPPALVDSDVKLVYLDLTDTLYGCSQVILKAVRCQAQKRVDKAVVTDNRQEGLFVVKPVGANKFRRCVRNVYRDPLVSH